MEADNRGSSKKSKITRNLASDSCYLEGVPRIMYFSNMVNHRTKWVETLFEALEDIDPKLKTLGIVEIGGNMTYVADGEEVDHA